MLNVVRDAHVDQVDGLVVTTFHSGRNSDYVTHWCRDKRCRAIGAERTAYENAIEEVVKLCITYQVE